MESTIFDIAQYVKDFHVSKQAGVVTNGRGAILEANNAISLMMNVDEATRLKGRLLVSYVHRKHVREFQELIQKVMNYNLGNSKSIWFRPRGQMAFQASVNAQLVMRSKSIVLIRWDISNLHLNTVTNTHPSSYR